MDHAVHPIQTTTSEMKLVSPVADIVKHRRQAVAILNAHFEDRSRRAFWSM